MKGGAKSGDAGCANSTCKRRRSIGFGCRIPVAAKLSRRDAHDVFEGGAEGVFRFIAERQRNNADQVLGALHPVAGRGMQRAQGQWLERRRQDGYRLARMSPRHLVCFIALGCFWGLSPSLYKVMGEAALPISQIIVYTGLAWASARRHPAGCALGASA